MVKIAVAPVTTIEGKAFKLPKFNDNGQLEWETAPANGVMGVPAMQDVTTIEVIKRVLYSIPDDLSTPLDSTRIIRILFYIEDSLEKQKDQAPEWIELSQKAYQWFHDLLGRQRIPTAKEKEANPNASIQTLAQLIFNNAQHAWITEQLKDQDKKLSKAQISPEKDF